MALHYRFEHEFDCDPKTFWDFFFTEDYNAEVYQALRMVERKMLEFKDEGPTIRRSQRFKPAVSLPSVLQKVIPDSSYTERNVFHKDKSAMDVVIEPVAMASKFDMRGTFTVTPAGEGRCKRVFEGDVKVSIMLVGGQVEKFMVEQMKTSYEIATKVTRDFIAKRKAKA